MDENVSAKTTDADLSRIFYSGQRSKGMTMRPPVFLQVFRFFAVCAAALCVAWPSMANAPSSYRLALVIGNAAYPGDAALANPGNDARAMAQTLGGMGFEVLAVKDGTRAQMIAAIGDAQKRLQGRGGVGMLYYAGHGVQLDWRNYLIPVDARFTGPQDVPAQAVDVSLAMDAFKAAGTRMNIVVLDACRDSPFKASAAKGLAPFDAPPGTFLAYATAPGNVADDGNSGNGLYTKYLLQELQRPQAKIEDVFKRVRLHVRQQSQGKQIPWETTSLEDDFVFGPVSAAAVAAATPRPPGPNDRELAFNQEKTEWDRIEKSADVAAIYAFLQRFPNGSFNVVAQAKLETLQKALVTDVLNREGVSAGKQFDTYKLGDRYTFESKDALSQTLRGRFTLEMTRAKEGGIEVVSDNPDLFPGALISSQGFLVRDPFGRYDPPLTVFPDGELKLGSKSDLRTRVTRPNGDRLTMDMRSKVLGYEAIETAMGTIKTVKLELIYNLSNGEVRTAQLWFEPGWGYAIKVSTVVTRNGAVQSAVQRDMVARSRKAS